jgi:hypothetical protein
MREHRAPEDAQTLTAGDIEALARRVLELVRDEPPSFGHADTSQVAQLLGVSDEWVREHAAELGAVRVGDGPRGTLRFELGRVRAALEARRVQREAVRPPRRPARRRSNGVELLPLPPEAR